MIKVECIKCDNCKEVLCNDVEVEQGVGHFIECEYCGFKTIKRWIDKQRVDVI